MRITCSHSLGGSIYQVIYTNKSGHLANAYE